MMKKAFVFILFFVLLFCTGCSDNNLSAAPSSSNADTSNNDYPENNSINDITDSGNAEDVKASSHLDETEPTNVETSHYYHESESEYLAIEKSILDRADNIVPADQLITKSYSFADFAHKYGAYFNARRFSGNVHSVLDIDEQYPIECMRDMGNGNYYAVYNIKEGGRWFLFFPNDAGKLYSYSVYVETPLDKTKFMKLRKGDNLPKVLEIDTPLSWLWNERKADSEFNSIGVLEDDSVMCTYHLFKDSIWLITYKIDPALLSIKSPEELPNDYLNKITITNIEKFSDQKLIVNLPVFSERNGEKIPASVNGTYDFTILPQDYPN